MLISQMSIEPLITSVSIEQLTGWKNIAEKRQSLVKLANADRETQITY